MKKLVDLHPNRILLSHLSLHTLTLHALTHFVVSFSVLAPPTLRVFPSNGNFVKEVNLRVNVESGQECQLRVQFWASAEVNMARLLSKGSAGKLNKLINYLNKYRQVETVTFVSSSSRVQEDFRSFRSMISGAPSELKSNFTNRTFQRNQHVPIRSRLQKLIQEFSPSSSRQQPNNQPSIPLLKRSSSQSKNSIQMPYKIREQPNLAGTNMPLQQRAAGQRRQSRIQPVDWEIPLKSKADIFDVQREEKATSKKQIENPSQLQQYFVIEKQLQARPALKRQAELLEEQNGVLRRMLQKGGCLQSSQTAKGELLVLCLLGLAGLLMGIIIG